MGDTRTEAWRVERGERETATFPVLTGTDLFPIEGWSVSAQILDRDGVVLYDFPAEQVSSNTDDNTVQLLIPAPVSALWTWTTARYRVLITEPGSDPADPATYRVLQGVLVLD
jgi:hypothetical protein